VTCVRIPATTGPRHGFICTDDGPLVDSNPGCRRADLHTPSPRGYVAAWAWAEQMMQTHDQFQCPGCGRWLVWEPKGDDRGDA
jgi:hypothetical protein